MLVFMLPACASCATWTDRADTTQLDKPTRAALGKDAGKSNRLPEVGKYSGAVVLEIEFAAIPIEAASNTEDNNAKKRSIGIWQWIDEAAIPLEQRKQLQANGMRIGKVIREDHVRDQLKRVKLGSGNVVDEFLSQAKVASELAQGEREVPLRFGQRSELPLHDPIPGTQVLMVKVDGETIGRTLLEPQFLLAMTALSGTSPRAVRLRLRPQIQHGAMKQSFVSSDSAIRIDTRRETWPLEHLNLDLEMMEGESLLLSSTSPAIGLGKQMLFGTSAEQDRYRAVAVIRVKRVPTLADRL